MRAPEPARDLAGGRRRHSGSIRNSPLAAYLHTSDVILLSLSGEPVRSAADLATFLKGKKPRSAVELGLDRVVGGVIQALKVQVR